MDGHSIRDIAAALGAEVLGDADIIIMGASEPRTAGPEHLALAMSERYAAELVHGRARAAVIGPDMDWQALRLEAAVVAPRPRYAMAAVTRAMDPGTRSRKAFIPPRSSPIPR
jgi:UDP-3-O-[3-hydroxymyristoyl] glucosamine N-acyltransferase